jgi:hypothetical protein
LPESRRGAGLAHWLCFARAADEGGWQYLKVADAPRNGATEHDPLIYQHFRKLVRFVKSRGIAELPRPSRLGLSTGDVRDCPFLRGNAAPGFARAQPGLRL